MHKTKANKEVECIARYEHLDLGTRGGARWSGKVATEVAVSVKCQKSLEEKSKIVSSKGVLVAKV